MSAYVSHVVVAAVFVLAYVAAAAAACPFRPPCNCSPGTGIAKFRGVCETMNSVNTTPCDTAAVAALAHAHENVTAQWLERHKTACDGFFMVCDADAASSCVIAPFTAPNNLSARARLCTGRRALSWGSVVFMIVFSTPIVLFAVLGCYELWSPTCPRRRHLKITSRVCAF
jgi:hypothetical protein